MNRLPFHSTICLLLLVLVFSACENGGFLRSKKSFTGTVEILYQTDRQYPDGRDSIIQNTETYEEVFEIIKTGKNEYKIVNWESGCDFRICCIPVPCPGESGEVFVLSDENELRSYWDYDFDNELKMKFDDKFKEVEITYWYSDGYFTDQYDIDADTMIYRQLDQEFYTFKGTR